MVFSSSSFLFLFLPAVFIGYLLVSRLCGKLRNAYLFLASMVFYCWNGTRYAALLLFSVAANYLLARGVGRQGKPGGKRVLLLLALGVNLGLLGYYKYANFFLSNLSLVSGRTFPLREIVLPLGISFYTFQAMSYLIDVYRGDPALRNPVDLGLYISFFPQLIAGPIVRYGQVRERLSVRGTTRDDFFAGMQRFLIGLCKKVILANHLGELADRVFSGGMSVKSSVFLLWLAAVAYTLQLYYDFSGYSDMAIGLGRLFGFSFPENFNYPYAASSISDFWRRWHMTLSGWFRDYVYIPLGGSRRGSARHVLNLLVVWLLTGLWHGAAWQFVFWGFAYFLLLVFEKYLLPRAVLRSRVGAAVYRVFTLLCVCLLWVVFRAEDFPAAVRFISGMFGLSHLDLFNAYGLFQAREYAFFLLAGLLFALPVLPALERKNRKFFSALHAAVLLIGTLLSIAFILRETYNPFLYFQF